VTPATRAHLSVLLGLIMLAKAWGYYLGRLDVDNPAKFRSAVEEFQCDHDLTVDGDCGPQTQAKLKQVYGC